MNIMISINREYMKYACVMLMSLKEHHKDILLSVYILHKEQKINSAIEGHISEISRSRDGDQVITEVEKALYQILECEFGIMDIFENAL